MRLEEFVRQAMVDAVNTEGGANAVIDFYTNTTSIPGVVTATFTGTGMLGATMLTCQSPMMDESTNGVGTFDTIGTATVGGQTGNVAYFALKKATNSTRTGVLLTGSVLTQTADITFNTTSWDAGDNVSITSLTFTQPAGS